MKIVVIENEEGISSGLYDDDCEVGDVVTIVPFDENGNLSDEQTGTIIEID
jgi:hypothetical protein